MVIDWKRVLGLGATGLAVSAALWFALRAYTGIFGILNLRVFVGIITLMPAMLAPVWAFDPTILAKNEDAKVPKSVAGAAAFLAAASILIGEFAGAAAKGAPVTWDKFNLICLLVCAVLPFQIERVLKKQ